VVEVETEWVELSDSRRLAARVFLPADTMSRPAPAILEYIPYRRRDGTRVGDETMHRWYAAHGYAALRVDIAGTGDSDGSIDDEYVQREQDDGLEVIEWIARQPWCTGAVGMIGISWGGFAGLQLAARRPPALRAVVSVCSAVDRYRGDCHYTGGCLNEENLEWGAYLFAMQGFPPDPAVVGARWREMWLDRIAHASLPPARWLHHQRRDEFWRHGSVCEDWSAIQIPVLAVSGWADGYPAAVFEIVEHLGPSARGILGPWGHKYAYEGVPGPAVGFLQETARWWDRWLRDDIDVADTPAMRMFLQDRVAPRGHVETRDGRWIEIDPWPGTGIRREPWWIDEHGHLLTGDRPNASVTAVVRSPVATGVAAGQWCAYGLGRIAPDLPLDQRTDDGGSWCADSEPSPNDLHIVGRPRVHLRVAADRPVAHVVVRLCSVDPHGSSERFSYGVLNLCHHAGDDAPVRLEPGRRLDVVVEMKGIAETIPAGHRIRLAIATTSWPMLWPSPEIVTLTIDGDGTWVDLPVLDAPVDMVVPFETPDVAEPDPVVVSRDGHERRTITHDPASRSTEVRLDRDDGTTLLTAIGTEQTFTRTRTASIVDDDPTSARIDLVSHATYRRAAWGVAIATEVSLTSTIDHFEISGRMTASEHGVVVAEVDLHERIERDHL
jgi:hypothetical protein